MAETPTADNDTLYGNQNNDEIDGLAGDDLIFGHSYSSAPFSEDGSDLLKGGEGNDTLIGGTGNDVLLGGAGNDKLISGPNKYYQGDYEYGDGPGGYADGYANTPSDVLLGGEGDDWAVVSYAGLVNSATNEQLAIHLVLVSGAGQLDIDNATYYGEYLESIETLTFSSGDKDDYLVATDGDDSITTNDGDDHIEAKGGNDVVNKGAGKLDVDGGAGDDFLGLDRSGDVSGIVFDGQTGELKVGGVATGAAVNFENFAVTGTSKDDVMTGILTGYNMLFGAGGDDTLAGGNGNDSLYGGADDDILTGAGGRDNIYDGSGNDRVQAGAGNDDVWFVLGNETDADTDEAEIDIVQTLEGGADTDTLHIDFFGAADWDISGSTITGFEKMALENYPFGDSYTVKMTTAQLLQFKEIDFSGDVFNNVTFVMSDKGKLVFGDCILALRNLQLADGGQFADFRKATGVADFNVNIYPTVFGGDGNDTIYGRDQDDRDFIVYAGAGKDKIIAGDSNTFLYGGLGNDQLTGSNGMDFFNFNTSIKNGKNIDTIKNFKHGIDEIGLLDDIFSKLGDTIDRSELRFGTKARDHNDFLIYDKKTGDFFYDVDGDGKKHAVQFAELTGKVDISVDDIFFLF